MSSENSSEIIIGKKYKLLNQIGEGSFGKIFKAENILTSSLVAIKIEKKSNSSLLKHEANIYYKCKNLRGIPGIRMFGTEENYNYIVMDLLGMSIDKMREIQGGKLTLKETLTISIQLISCLENLHAIGIIHRDIKPENILINGDINKIYLIDFGLAKYYIDQERNHLPINNNKKFIGNVRFASINIHNGIEPSRRDDLISLGYVFIVCLKGFLPWQNINSMNKDEKYNKIKNIKETLYLPDLCSDIPYEFLSYMSYCYSLKYDEDPDYLYLKNLFINLCRITDRQ
jgi:serine/threonine protein kinase